MKYGYRIFTGALALMLVLGSVGYGRADASTDTVVTEPTQATALDTAVEESPGKTWFVPSEEECPTASLVATPLVMTVEDVTSTQATLVLRAKDGSEFSVGYGEEYGIERFEENGWVGVDLRRAFPEPYSVISARQEHWDTVEFMADGTPLEFGYYRVRKEYLTIVHGEGVNITYYAYFELSE